MAPGAAAYVSIAGSDTNDGSLARPWRTLAKAAATVAAGTTVYVRSGSYAPVTVTRSGTAGAPITFRSFPGETATVAGDGSRATVILLSGVHDIVISDLTVQGAPSQWGAGIRVENSDRISVTGNVLRENRSFGLKIANSTNVTVARNDISRNETGIELSVGGAGIVISDNDIHDNDRMVVNTVGGNDDRGANGIVLYKTTGSILVSGNRIWNNRAVSYDYGFDGGAFEVYAASNLTFRANVVWNNENVLETGTDGTLPCDANRFERNVAYGGARTGPTMGMILRCASNMLIANNSFHGLDRFVFDVTASASSFGGSIDGLRIVNNVAVQSGAKVYSIDSAMPSSVSVDHDAAFDTTGGSIAYVYGHGNTTSLATFRSWTGFEPAGIQADARFIDPAAADFRLGATSPAIDRGVLIAGTTDGFLGSAPDLGAIESTP